MNNIPEYNNTKSIIWLSKILRKRINNTLDLSLSEDYRKWFISFNNYSNLIKLIRYTIFPFSYFCNFNSYN